MRGLMPRRPLSRESLMLFRRPPIEYRGRPHGAYVSRSGIAIRYLMPSSTCGDSSRRRSPADGATHPSLTRIWRRATASHGSQQPEGPVPAREARRLPCSSQPLTFTKTSSNASVKVTVTAERRQCCHEAQMIEVRSSSQRTRCLQRPNLPTVAAKMNGREATATLGPSARRFLCG